MKRLLTLLLLLGSFLGHATTYYVATNGNDSRTAVQAQNINTPWATIDKGWTVLVAGDTLYIRGGTYNMSGQHNFSGHSGNSSAFVNIFGYLQELPIFSWQGVSYPGIDGLSFNNVNYIHLYHLRVTNMPQSSGSQPFYNYGFFLSNVTNSLIEFCEADLIGGSGFGVGNSCNNNTVLNCDSHDNADPFSAQGAYQNANGFEIASNVQGNINYITNCRAWWNADDGIDAFNGSGTNIISGCWAFWNGYIPGTFTPASDGDGFKLGPSALTTTANLRTVTNNLSFENHLFGFDQNFNSNGSCQMLLYNNTAYKNTNVGFFFFGWTAVNTLKNNISYANGGGGQSGAINPQSIQSNNSWNGGVTVTDADFVCVDTSGVRGPRQSNGALPNLCFMHLATGSDLINAGTPVGLPYVGSAPDMGCFEYLGNFPNQPPVVNAGADSTIVQPASSVHLIGTATDPDGNVVSTLWTQIGGPSSTITSAGSLTTTVTAMNTTGSYTYKLLATDNLGATASDTVIILVQPAPNQPPVANAGSDKAITLPTSTITQVGSGTDADGTIVAYLWTFVSGPAGGAPVIVSASQATTVINNLLVAGTYTFQLRVTDNSGATATDQMQVVVSPQPTTPPVVNAGPDQSITLPTTSSVFAGSASAVSPATSISSHTWSFVSGPGATPTITTPSSFTSTVTGMTIAGSYTFKLTAVDNLGGTNSDNMVILVSPAPNQPPTANAGSDKAITLPTSTITQVGSGTDPDGTISAYLWTFISGPAGGAPVIVSASQATTVINNLLIAGTYTFQLRVTDNQGATATDQMQVVVSPKPNIPPTALAGPDQIITLPTSSVTMAGSAIDSDGTISSHVWSFISGPGPTPTITTPTSYTTTVTGMTLTGLYSFKLLVTDNQGATGADTMTVFVNPAANIPPTADAGPDQTITLPTNSVSLTGSGTDPDGTIVAYAWTRVSGPSSPTITAPNSQNTSVTGLVQGVYVFRLVVTDNQGASGQDNVQITVNPAINQPPVVHAGPDQTIQLPTSSATMAGSATDPDGTIVSHTWTFLNGPVTPTITTPSSYTTTITGMTVASSYQFKLTATDNVGATGSDTMIVTVTAAANVPPVAHAGNDTTITLPTGTLTGNVIFHGSGTDADGTIVAYLWSKVSGPASYTIVSASQAVTAVNNLVYGVYFFQLRVTDNSGATATDQVMVTVDTTFVPPPPVWTPPTANAGPDVNVLLPARSSTTSTTINGSGHSDSGTIVSYQWTQLSGPNTANIVSSTSATTQVKNLIRGTYTLQLKVIDNMAYQATDTMRIIVKKNYIIWKNGKAIVVQL